jgi:threonine/homoserine/homoserine lactone efflux protein
MTLPLLFLFSFAVGFGAVVTPGPVSTAVVVESARRGFVVGPLVATGHVALEFVMVAILALGLSHGLQTPPVIVTISVVGGLLLIWMGGSMVWGAAKGKMALPKPGVEAKLLSNWQLLGLGIGATLVNPFWYAWWIAVGTTYLVLPQVRVFGLLVFYLGHIAGDYLWDSTLSGVVGGGRKWLTNRIYQALIVVCGLYLVYLGGQFGLSGWQLFQGLVVR